MIKPADRKRTARTANRLLSGQEKYDVDCIIFRTGHAERKIDPNEQERRSGGENCASPVSPGTGDPECKFEGRAQRTRS